MQESDQASLVLLLPAVTSGGLSLFFGLSVYPSEPMFVSQVTAQTLVRILLLRSVMTEINEVDASGESSFWHGSEVENKDLGH